MSRWIFSFVGIDPCNPENGRWEMGVEEEYYKHLQHHGHEKAIARLWLVGHVLDGGTDRIYKGWCRPDKGNCYVYVGYPSLDYKSLTITTPPPPGMAFLIFVLPNGSIADWTWRPIKEGGDTPDGLEEGEIIWRQSTT